MLEQLFEGPSAERFWSEHWLRLPFASPGQARAVVSLGDWEALRAIADRAGGEVLLAREGRFRPEALSGWAEVQVALSEGWTLSIRHAERYHEGLAALAEAFADRFASPVDIQFFATPEGNPGFGWHYDVEDVFILQTVGVKEYSLRKNTVHPWPIPETMPLDLRYEAEQTPLSRCRLSAGDWLYLPHGYWHRTEAIETSLSLAVGLLTASGVDVLDFLRRELAASLEWRQRLTPIDDAASRHTCAQLAADLRRRLGDPELLERFWRCRRA